MFFIESNQVSQNKIKFSFKNYAVPNRWFMRYFLKIILKEVF